MISGVEESSTGSPEQNVTMFLPIGASIGFNRDAFSAGKNPEPIPSVDRITNEMSIALIEACRKTTNS
jgi:hypothetical protein